jgi:hypothetical protein
VTGPILGLFCRFLHRALASRSSWYSSIALDAPAIGELRFWRDHLDSFQSRNIWRRFSVLPVLYYDAGGNRWGGHLHIGPEVHEAHGLWKPLERHGSASSTWQELSALLRLLRSFCPRLLQDCTVLARGDARNVFSILQKGGLGREHLQQICLEIFAVCLEHRVDFRPEWLPREENVRADYLSKIRDVNDFGVSSTAFAQISTAIGPFSVDRFASPHNAKLARFDAFFWCPGVGGVNAFTQDWGGAGVSYCFPPPHLVPRTLQHAARADCSSCPRLAVRSLVAAFVRQCRVWEGFCTFRLAAPLFPLGARGPRSRLGVGGSVFGKGVPLCDVFVLDVDFSCRWVDICAHCFLI